MRLPVRLRRASRNPTGEMPILDHLIELRNRIILSLGALVLAAVGGWFLWTPAIRFVTNFYCQIPPASRAGSEVGDDCRLAFLSPIDPLTIRLQVALVLGLIIALPLIAFQIWRFVAPGLKPKEKRYAIPFAMGTFLLFASGVVVAAFALPRGIEFLVGLAGDEVSAFFTADRYLKFVMYVGLAFGIGFELPLVLVFLSLSGVLSSGAMLKAWRPAVALIIILAAVITPTGDPVSLFALAGPMWLFYFASIGIARYLIEPARDRRRARELGR